MSLDFLKINFLLDGLYTYGKPCSSVWSLVSLTLSIEGQPCQDGALCLTL
jgi:hypothetical protein